MRNGWECMNSSDQLGIEHSGTMNAMKSETLVSLALDIGAATVGVTSAEPFDREERAITDAVADGRSGLLRFTYDAPHTSTHLTESFEWARSVVAVTLNYVGDSTAPADTGPLIARFAQSDRYESVRRITAALADAIRNVGGRAEELIDDNRLVDRAASTRSGAGWQGKSTMVLAPGHGPWLLLGSVVTDLDLEATLPMKRDCGTCSACIPACPTGAITDQGLNAARCISTWLQTAGSMPLWIRPLIGRRIYGCDDCLTSCPPGMRTLDTQGKTNQPHDFAELLALTDDQLLDQFSWWYVPRRDGRFIRRNLLVAAGNSRESDLFQSVQGHLSHRSSMIRGHAAWALARSEAPGAGEALEEALKSETVEEPRIEIGHALEMLAS